MVSCPSFEENQWIDLLLAQVLIFTRRLGSASQTWLILSISKDLLWSSCSASPGGAHNCSRDKLDLECFSHSLNMTTLNRTVFTKLQIPGNGEEKKSISDLPLPSRSSETVQPSYHGITRHPVRDNC